MASYPQWKVSLAGGREEIVYASTLEVLPSGALLFKNNGEDSPVRVFSSGEWIDVIRVTNRIGW